MTSQLLGYYDVIAAIDQSYIGSKYEVMVARDFKRKDAAIRRAKAFLDLNPRWYVAVYRYDQLIWDEFGENLIKDLEANTATSYGILTVSTGETRIDPIDGIAY